MNISKKMATNKGQNYRSQSERMAAARYIALKAGIAGWSKYLKGK